MTNLVQFSATPSINPAELTIVNGQVTTSSLHVADHFGKPHRDVLTRIRALDCSPEFSERNFSLAEYIDSQHKNRPYYRMTRDGFTFLCMGFTGKQAAKWKEAYINAFNQMEAQLQAPVPAASPFNTARVLVAFDATGKAISQAVPEDACVLRPAQLPELVTDPMFMNADDLAPLAEAVLRRLLAQGGEKAVRQVLVEVDNNWLLVNAHKLINVHNEMSLMLMQQACPKRIAGR